MLNLRNVTLLIFLFILTACTTAPNLTVVGTSGEPIPDPFYTAGTTSGSHMMFTWYYVRYEGIKDLDQSVQLIPVYLDRNKTHYIARKKIHGFNLTLRIFNPAQEEYTIFVYKNIKYSDGRDERKYYSEGSSHLEFREWSFPYPYSEQIDKMESFIEVRRKKDIILRTKKFSYSLE